MDNKLKDHQGIAPDPAQYPDTWYINHTNRTIETHTTIYQYVVNHQMQADSIAQHLGTTSATSLSSESYVEIICTFCQTIDHANRKVVQEKSHCKALQAEFNGGCNTNCGGGHSSWRGHNPGRSSAHQANPGGCGRGKYHNWIPRDQFDNLDDESYQQLIRERVAHGEVQANTTSTAPTPPVAHDLSVTHTSTPTVPVSQINRKISMIFALVSCCSCVNIPSSS